MATCGFLEALGSGDVEFHYRFRDRHVIFTLRGCLYVSTATKNLLSVGTLLERGMSCPSLCSPDGITEVFYPDQHPKFPGLAFSATVINHLSFLSLDFIPPVVSSVPAAFPVRVSPESPRVFRRKPSSLPKMSKPSFSNPHYLVVDTILPSHIFHDRSLFSTYAPSRKLHRTILGTEIVIEGTGDVHICVFVSRKSILFCFRDCWHVPSSPHHFFSSLRAVSLGNQIMISGCSPRMIFSHQKRLVDPNFPKYMHHPTFIHFQVFFLIEVQLPVYTRLN